MNYALQCGIWETWYITIPTHLADHVTSVIGISTTMITLRHLMQKKVIQFFSYTSAISLMTTASIELFSQRLRSVTQMTQHNYVPTWKKKTIFTTSNSANSRTYPKWMETLLTGQVGLLCLHQNGEVCTRNTSGRTIRSIISLSILPPTQPIPCASCGTKPKARQNAFARHSQKLCYYSL